MLNEITKAEVDALRITMRNEMKMHLPVWRLLSKYIAPKRLKENGKRVDGSRKDQHIIRNTAGRSLRTFVSGMMNGATPRSRPWFDLVVSDPMLMDSAKVKKHMEAREKILNNYFQVSNLYRALPLMYKDVGIFSNSACAQLPHPRYGFYFYPYAIGTYAFSCDAEGNTNMFTRDTTMTVRQVVQEFAPLNPKSGRPDLSRMDKAVAAAWESARYLDDVHVAQVILPNPNYNPTTARTSLNPRASKFQAYTYVLGMGGHNNTLPVQGGMGFRDNARNKTGDNYNSVESETQDYLKVSGYNYFPVITPRWEIEPEGSYGIDGPGHIALSDVITLQEQEKLRMEGSYKLVRPPMLGHASLRRHHSSILAGGITYLDDRGMNIGFKPAFEVGPALADLVANQADVESAIQSAFYEDLFMMLSGQETKSHVTAAEVNERSAERMAVLAPVLGQWDFDISSKVIDNSQIILESQGRMPERPEEMRDKDIRPEYTSILAQAAKASLITTQERFVNFLASYSQSTGNPSLMKIAKDEQFIREYASNIGLNPQLLNDEREYKKIAEAMMQQQAAARQVEVAGQQAQTAKTLSETRVDQGSLLDTMAEASSF